MWIESRQYSIRSWFTLFCIEWKQFSILLLNGVCLFPAQFEVIWSQRLHLKCSAGYWMMLLHHDANCKLSLLHIKRFPHLRSCRWHRIPRWWSFQKMQVAYYGWETASGGVFRWLTETASGLPWGRNCWKHRICKWSVIPQKVAKFQAYLILVIFFTQAKFLENKIYTEKTRKLRQNTQ